ncbi:hypothetical protein [Streptomyces sp. NPDC048665]|uniref:hypothetical protein n=1 Tax=Streptomyces sp. NPDC048665 TaxID=3155490 RepID=UPI00342CC368
MTTCSSSPRPDDALTAPAPATLGVHAPLPDLLATPAALSPRPVPESFERRPEEIPHELPYAIPYELPYEGLRDSLRDVEGEASEGGGYDGGGVPDRDPLRGLVHSAVADRPIEDVVRLITLLESSPEHSRATVDALRAIGLGRSVEDLARLVALLTRPPRGTDSADEAIRAAAQGRPVEEVTRLIRLLHHASVEPHCRETVLQAAAVNLPLEELAELIGRLATDRTAFESGPVHLAPAAAVCGTGTMSMQAGERQDRPADGAVGREEPRPARRRVVRDRWVAAAMAAQWAAERSTATEREADRPTAAGPVTDDAAPTPSTADVVTDVAARDEPMRDVATAGVAVRGVAAADVATREEPTREVATADVATADVRTKARPLTGGSAGQRAVEGSGTYEARGRRSSRAALWPARGAALLVLLCGVAHAPRSWAGPRQGVLVAGAVAAGLCLLLALVLALPPRTAMVRLGTATAALGVGAALAAGQLLRGRLGLPDAFRLWDVTLAPWWLAGTAALATALAALVVLVVVLVGGRAGRSAAS